MPVTIQWDLANGSKLTGDASGPIIQNELVRPGLMTGLPADASNQELLLIAKSELLASNAIRSEHPENGSYRLVRYEITPAASRSAFVTAIYQNRALVEGDLGGGVSVYVIEDDTTLVEREENFYIDSSGTSHHLTVEHEPTGDEKAKVLRKGGSLRILRPLRTLRMTATVFGVPPINPGVYTGVVNSEPWRGGVRASWILSNVRTQWGAGLSTYDISATATKAVGGGFEDWRRALVAYNSATGAYVQLPSTVVTDARNEPYQYGKIFEDNGIVVIGPYELYSFSALFGIS